jgi:hypothetical protein
MRCADTGVDDVIVAFLQCMNELTLSENESTKENGGLTLAE